MYMPYIPTSSLETFALDFVRREFESTKLSDDLPYYFHCETVAVFTKALLPTPMPLAASVALLHDVYEDLSTDVAQALLEGLAELLGTSQAYFIDNALGVLTKTPSMSRQDYISRICEVSEEFEFVKYIKLADLTHNSLIGRFKRLETAERSLLRISKYQSEYAQIFASLR